MKGVQKMKDFLQKGNVRSLKAKKNILQMIVIKEGTILLGFNLVPLTIDYDDSKDIRMA